jgi:hypothetical protein
VGAALYLIVWGLSIAPLIALVGIVAWLDGLHAHTRGGRAEARGIEAPAE